MGTRYDPPSPTNCLGDLVSRGGGGREGPGEEEASCLARPGGIEEEEEEEEEEKPFLRDCAALHNDVPLLLPLFVTSGENLVCPPKSKRNTIPLPPRLPSR